MFMKLLTKAGMRKRVTVQSIEDWFKEDRLAHLSEGQCLEFMHLFHPRTVFLKTLPHGSSVLDVGAGDGALPNFKSWPAPAREDLRMFAYSLEKGVNFDAYDRYEIGNWETARPNFDGMQFDAIFSSHFIEHISKPIEFICWAGQRLSRGGRIYVEWPSENSLKMPSRGDLLSRGIEIMISNFRDDHTHRKLPNAKKIRAALRKAGLDIDQLGYVRYPYFEDEVMALFGGSNRDQSAEQLAFWSKYRWAQYIVASKL